MAEPSTMPFLFVDHPYGGVKTLFFGKVVLKSIVCHHFLSILSWFADLSQKTEKP